MSMQTVVSIVSFSLLLFTQVSHASIGGGVNQENSDMNREELKQPDQDPLNPEQSTITGKIRFERRYTRVENGNCPNEPCQESESYWSLVIESQGMTYLFNEKLSMGSAKAPEFIKLAGVLLRSGSLVKIEGQVVTGGPKFFILLDVKSVTLLMD